MMSFKINTFSVLAGVVLLSVLVSCEEELTTIGNGLIGGEPFETNSVIYPVFAKNKKLTSVSSNKLPVYQLGTYIDPIYGKTEAKITSQVQLSTLNPTFGTIAQDEEGSSESKIDEMETVKEVFLFIPFLTDDRDDDGDGVDNEFDVDPLDPNRDSDGDGVTDNAERIARTDPLNEDTDGDGTLDGADADTAVTDFPNKFNLDSIYIDSKQPSSLSALLSTSFNLKVEKSNFFLRDLDPNTNFTEAQDFFSDKDFSSFLGETLYSGEVTISDTEVITFNDVEDDPDTEVDESKVVDVSRSYRPGIRVSLDTAFFQENILDKEGDNVLVNNDNFKDFFRGIHLSIEDSSEDIFMMLNMGAANITVIYDHKSIDNNGTADDTSDDTIVELEKSYILNLITASTTANTGLVTPGTGNAVNTFINDAYPLEITSAISSNDNDAEKIYLKGGAGSYAQINLFDLDNGLEEINQIKANNWIINEASLVFYVDQSEFGIGAIEPERLYMFKLEDNLPLVDPSSELPVQNATAYNIYPFFDGVLERDDTGKGLKYRIRITDYINDLVIRGAENATLGLTVTSDIRNFSSTNTMSDEGERTLPLMANINPLGTVLFGSSNVNPPEKRLQLEISYTKAN